MLSCSKFLEELEARLEYIFREYTVKKFIHFPVPSRDVTYQTLPCREKFNYSRPERVFFLVCDIPARDGKIINHFLQCKFFE